jgi:hypothetical protein
MAAAAGGPTARVGGIVAAVLCCAALGGAAAPQSDRDPAPEPFLAGTDGPPSTDPEALRALAARVQRPAEATAIPGAEVPATAPPLPGPTWNDPDSVNWANVPEGDRAPVRERILERRGGPRPGGRLLDRLRGELRSASVGGRPVGDVITPAEPPPSSTGWPDAVTLRDHLSRLAARPAPIGPWATSTLEHMQGVAATGGPADPAAAAALMPIGDDVESGMSLADGLADAALATEVRRAALAVARRVAVWRAAAAACAPPEDGIASGDVAATFIAESTASATGLLLASLETFEVVPTAATAARVHEARSALGPAAAAVGRAVDDHYLAPNFRVSVHRTFVAKLLPEATVTSGPMQDFVLGRPVRGTRRVEQSTDVRFVPDPDEIRVELLVDGVVTSRTVAESGPVAIHSRATAEFLVRKPITVSAAGLSFSRAVGTASNQSRLADVQTSFDSVPIMGPLMRSIARNQHDDHHAEATREVNDKIVVRACREVDRNTEPKFRDLAERVRSRVWQPLVSLGLDPQAVALETTADTATARIRLAGAGQLAAHTPRPRAPADAVFSVQVHESSVNNACERFGLAGRRLTVEDLVRTVCGRLGVPPRIPDDLPADVEVAFAAEEPLRVECRDGLVHVRMALDAIESGRRAWYDVVAQVAYRPVIAGPQVFLEREGPVRLSGAGQQGKMEIGLRTIVGKIFPKERPVPLLPAEFTGQQRLADVRAVQAVCTDGWIALALGAPLQAADPKAAPAVAEPGRRITRR